jgi:uncharacterized protein with WD repeat
VEDGKEMATMEAKSVQCLAVSKDGKWIAAGTSWPEGEVFVWDARTYKKVFHSHADREDRGINAVDFSPDSTRLVSASWSASIWDIATGKRVHTFIHMNSVTAAKYSPQGDRIATATSNAVQVWDSINGGLVKIKVSVTPWFNTGLLWFKNDLFVLSDSKIKQFETSTGSAASEWPVPGSNNFSCIALPKRGEFIAYSTKRTVTFWDTATHTQLGLIQHPQDIHSITVSPDDRFLAIGGEYGIITINHLSRITVSILSRWIMVHMNNFLAPIIFLCNPIPVSSTPRAPGTRHSDRRCCAPFLEARSTRKRGSIIDRGNPRVSESKSSCTR